MVRYGSKMTMNLSNEAHFWRCALHHVHPIDMEQKFCRHRRSSAFILHQTKYIHANT